MTLRTRVAGTGEILGTLEMVVSQMKKRQVPWDVFQHRFPHLNLIHRPLLHPSCFHPTSKSQGILE